MDRDQWAPPGRPTWRSRTKQQLQTRAELASLPDGVAVGGGEGEFEAQGGSGIGWAVEEKSPAQRLDAVFEAEQPGAVGQVGAAASVVADLNPQCARTA